MRRSILKYLTLLIFCGMILAPVSIVFAQDAVPVEAADAATQAAANTEIWKALAASFCITVAAVGGAMAQSKATTAGLEGIARNPGAASKIFTPMLLGLALIESLVIYALIIAFILVT